MNNTLTIRLHVTGINLDSVSDLEKIAANMDDYLWESVDGVTTMTVFTTGAAVDAIAIARADVAEHGVTVVRVAEDRVNVGEIARRIGGVSREAVRKWALLPTFPEPRFVVASDTSRGASKMWDWTEVVEWLLLVKRIDLEEQLPTSKTVAHINAILADIPAFVTRLVWRTIDVPQLKVDSVHPAHATNWAVGNPNPWSGLMDVELSGETTRAVSTKRALQSV